MEKITRQEIAQQLQSFIQNTIVEKHVVVQEDTPFNQLGIDSMSIIELVLFIERKFKIAIPESELLPANFAAVRTLADCAFRNQK
jgi:acyl carrier protein